jgi:DNA-directed RNA polymerase sigma subunit (sigma70/sigma32)
MNSHGGTHAEGMTLQEIADELGVGLARAWQLERRAVRKLWRTGIRGRYRAQLLEQQEARCDE